MGIAANQARLMALTARQNDLEYRAQQISATKMQLSQTSSTLAKNYADALNNYSKLNSAYQMQKQYAGYTKKVIVDGEEVEKPICFTVNKDGSFSMSETGTSAADLLQAVSVQLGVGVVTDPSGYLTIQKETYDTETAQISSIEKIYDMDLTQVNTEHDAIKTEYDAIKSLVGDNVEKSFNVFG